MLHKFEQGQNTMEATQDICCVKGEGTVDGNIVTRWLKKFCTGRKNLDNLVKSGGHKTMDSETAL